MTQQPTTEFAKLAEPLFSDYRHRWISWCARSLKTARSTINGWRDGRSPAPNECIALLRSYHEKLAEWERIGNELNQLGVITDLHRMLDILALSESNISAVKKIKCLHEIAARYGIKRQTSRDVRHRRVKHRTAWSFRDRPKTVAPLDT